MGLNWNVLMAKEYHTMQVDRDKALIQNRFSWRLRKIYKNPGKICSILSLIWTDRTDLKIPIFSILTTGEKYHASRQRPKKRKQKMKLSLSREEVSMDRPILWGARSKQTWFVICTVEPMTQTLHKPTYDNNCWTLRVQNEGKLSKS